MANYTTNPITAITNNATPRSGFSSLKPDLLTGEGREQIGLSPFQPKQKQTLDGTPNGLGKEDFLKLLLTQMSNQDPLKPMEDKEFISQLAQFNTLEQMQQVNAHMVDLLAGMSLGEASNLLGKIIQSGAVQGVVTAVTMSAGKAKLTVATADGETQVALAAVTRVVAGASAEEELDVMPANPGLDPLAGTP